MTPPNRRWTGVVSMAVSWLALVSAPFPASASPQPTPGAAQAFTLGKLRFVALRDALNVVDNDGKTFGLDAGSAAVSAALNQAGAATDKITLGVDALLVVEPGRVILIDTGLGPGVHGALQASLAEAGVSPSAITDVLITHSHGDHVGGLAAGDGRLAFPNATIRMSSDEWSWMKSQPRATALSNLIASKVRTFQPGEAVAPGVTAIALAGHTPGHVGYEIVSGGERLIDIGDTAHSAIVSLAHPEWTLAYDNDKPLARTRREATLAGLAASHEWVFAPHFPFPGVGKIVVRDRGYAWAPSLP